MPGWRMTTVDVSDIWGHETVVETPKSHGSEVLHLRFSNLGFAEHTMEWAERFVAQLDQLRQPPYNSRTFDELHLHTPQGSDAEIKVLLHLSKLHNLRPKNLRVIFQESSRKSLLSLDQTASEANWPLEHLQLWNYASMDILPEMSFFCRFTSIHLLRCNQLRFPLSVNITHSHLRSLEISFGDLADTFMELASVNMTSSLESLRLDDGGAFTDFQRHELRKFAFALRSCTSLTSFEMNFRHSMTHYVDVLRFLPQSVNVLCIRLPKQKVVPDEWHACVSHPDWLPSLQSFMIGRVVDWNAGGSEEERASEDHSLQTLIDAVQASRPGIEVYALT